MIFTFQGNTFTRSGFSWGGTGQYSASSTGGTITTGVTGTGNIVVSRNTCYVNTGIGTPRLNTYSATIFINGVQVGTNSASGGGNVITLCSNGTQSNSLTISSITIANGNDVEVRWTENYSSL